MRILAAALLASTMTAGIASAAEKSRLVHLADVAPSVEQDIRYAGPDNFTGAPVPGYQAAECMLLAPVAKALALVQRDLQERGYSLKVYDCYRPQTSVRAFADWAERKSSDADASRRFHPRIERRSLFAAGYISRSSGHSRGIAVDLTVTRHPAPRVDAFDPNRRYADCNGPIGMRSPDNGLDMGTSFDCFDAAAHTSAAGTGKEQAENRRLLLQAMQRHGFVNYHREWWHFSFPAAAGGPAFDVPVTARASR